MLDTFGFLSLGLFGPVAIGVIVWALPVTVRMRFGTAVLLSVWFIYSAVAPPHGAVFGIVVPVLVVPLVYAASTTAQRAVAGMNIAALIALHVSRLAGGFFILLHADGRLANPFAALAGWGDILAATTAIPAAILAYRQNPGWQKWVLAWNVIGCIDFITAVFLGATSQPGTPIQLFFEPPGAAILGRMPWRLIPNYFVPVYLIVHAAIFIRLYRDWRPRVCSPAAATAL
jgi:hypothetical protein